VTRERYEQLVAELAAIWPRLTPEERAQIAAEAAAANPGRQ
jgi:hypothetical protein